MEEKFYIWLNPVVSGMYDPEVLEDLLSRHGCTRVDCQGDWVSTVREKYRLLAGKGTGILVDARCPMAVDLVRQCQKERGACALQVAEVEPILIHAARELAGREDLRNRAKLITTPCAALADMGNALELEQTYFVVWKALLRQWEEDLRVQRLEASPIPPGFFDELGIPVKKVTGRESIAAYACQKTYGGEQLAEMLYCQDGCHNGDGVLWE